MEQEKDLLEKLHEVFEKQVLRLEVALSPELKTLGYMQGKYASDYERFRTMQDDKTIPGKEIMDSELDYIKQRISEIEDLRETILADQGKRVADANNDGEVILIGPHQQFIDRLDALLVNLGKSIIYFAPMGATLLYVWSLLQDDVATAQSKFDAMRDAVEELLVESGTITQENLNKARNA